MQCLAFLCGMQPAGNVTLHLGQEQQAGADAAYKLMENFETVVQDITKGPVDPKHISHVEKMLKAVCCRLLGASTAGQFQPPHTKEWLIFDFFMVSEDGKESLVWMHAARFLLAYIQRWGMSHASTTAMLLVLGQIEAGSKILFERQLILNDITKHLELNKVQIKPKNTFNEDPDEKLLNMMLMSTSTNLLLGTPEKVYLPDSARQNDMQELVEMKERQVKLSAEAAKFLAARIQEPDWQNDMSSAAATVLRTFLGQAEAAWLLLLNRENVVKDITNAGGINNAESVAKMVNEAGMQLLGDGVAVPLPDKEMYGNPKDAQVWAHAAKFLCKRLQSCPPECEGLKDMSPNAAGEMRAVLRQIELGAKLMSGQSFAA